MDFKSKKVAIIGYGIEGQDAEKFLSSRGAIVTILDQKDNPKYLDNLNSFDIIVRSPGVYPYKKEIIEATKNSVLVTTPTNIFFEECLGLTIGVTGTKGKGTTSTLIYEILKNAGKDVYLGGNIGKPLLQLLPNLNKESVVVMEMSSFQLIDTKYSPDIAVVLNVTSDHMDWHMDINEYMNAKKNIVRFQSDKNFAVTNSEYQSSKSFSEGVKSKVIFFSKNDLDDKYKRELILRGEHNLENIAAAVTVAGILEIDEKTIIKSISEFKGLEHRLEFVREINGIKFYNDSFATGPQPTIAAIKSFTEDETIILGGSDKGLNYEELGNVINNSPNVKNIILIGLIRNEIKKYIKNKNVIDLETNTMDKIVSKAFEITSPGGVIILSPAAASFDMFKDYKDRGNQFKKAVNNL